MKEQTKIAILLIIVIIVAVMSLIFIFYQYNKIQSQFTSRVIEQIIENKQQTTFQAETNPKLLCQKPNCYYDSQYRFGPKTIETESIDINGQNVIGCHNEGTRLIVKLKEIDMTQNLQCAIGGWVLVYSKSHK